MGPNSQQGFEVSLNHKEIKVEAQWWSNDGYTKIITYTRQTTSSTQSDLVWVTEQFAKHPPE